VLPITGISSILAVLIDYASQTFPTRIRSREAAGGRASKLGGVAIIALVVAGAPRRRSPDGVVYAVPMVLGALAMAMGNPGDRAGWLEGAG